MAWRGFLIGLLAVLGLTLLTPVNDCVIGDTYLTGNHFPVGVFFSLLALLLVLNVGARAVHRRLALRRQELMLVLCMMLVSATVPASGLMRYWFSLATSPAYLSQRPDIPWEETILARAPEGLLLSTDGRSAEVHSFFHGTQAGDAVRVPWRERARRCPRRRAGSLRPASGTREDIFHRCPQPVDQRFEPEHSDYPADERHARQKAPEERHERPAIPDSHTLATIARASVNPKAAAMTKRRKTASGPHPPSGLSLFRLMATSAAP
ncbi:MAG: DUF6785 family protein [Candidatus Brocadiia bacterium]